MKKVEVENLPTELVTKEHKKALGIKNNIN